MEKIPVMLKEANSVFKTSDHLIYMTYPLVQDNKLSLLVITFLMNITTNNQGDHCIVAANLLDPSRLIDEDNLALFAAQDQCRELGPGYGLQLMPVALDVMAGGYVYG